MRWFLFLMGFFLMPIGLFAEKVVTLTVSDLERLVLEKNGILQSELLNIEAAKIRMGYLARSFLPEISLNSGSETFDTLGSVDVVFPLYRGGRDANEEASRKVQVQLAQYQWQMRYLSERVSAQILYGKIVQASELLDQYRASLKIANQALSSAKRRRDRGVSTASDVLKFSILIRDIKEKMTQVVYEQKSSEITLKSLLGMSQEVTLGLDASRDQHREALKAGPLPQISLELLMLQATTRLLELRKERRAGANSLSIEAYGGYPDGANSRGVLGGLRAHVPLFDGFQTQHEVNALDKEIAANTVRYTQQKSDWLAKMQNAKAHLFYLDDLIKSATQKMAESSTYLGVILDEYSLGTKEAADVSEALALNLEYSQEISGYKLAFVSEWAYWEGWGLVE